MASRSLNKVMLIGNVVRDPELRYTPQNTAVCQLTIATNRSWTGNDGNQQESAEFTRVVVWGKLAEITNEILKKGKKAYVEGRLQTRSWDGKDGEQKKVTEVVAEQVIALDGRDGRAGGDEDRDFSYPEGNKNQKRNNNDEDLAVNDAVGGGEDIADDIPF